MATSIRQFNIDLYREHLEEASFLYEQRLAYLHDPEVNWPDLNEWEERFEAHIDALVVGGELALDVCRRQAIEGDAGEMHAALRVLCRQDRKDDAFAIVNGIDPGDEPKVRAASQALRCELPKAWREDLPHWLEGDRPHLTQVAASVIGYRRFPYEEPLSRALAATRLGTAELAWALGRVGSARSAPALLSLLDDADERTCEAAALALLRLGDERALERAMLAASKRRWARRVLGIGGGPASVRVLLDFLEKHGPDEDAVLALGLLGDLAAVAPLLQLLKDDGVGPAAAVSLNTITGAALHATVFVPDEIDVDELSDEERAAYERDGTLPTRGGQPYGSWRRGPLRDQAGWRTWLVENKQRFSRELRWRMGQPYGPSALVDALKCATSPYQVRSASHEELAVRYALDVPFEVELRARQQQRFLGKIESWAAAQAGRFTKGRWYFAGRVHG